MCNVTRVLSLLLYNIYSTDPRYVLDQDEEARLGIGEGQEFRAKDCLEHGYDQRSKEKQRSLLGQTGQFTAGLRKPEALKIGREKQCKALVDKIRDGQEPRLSRLGEGLKEASPLQQAADILN